jgi:hypothetical protein
VDLATICFVRVVDIPGTGDFYDGFSTSNRIYDPSPTVVSGGIDIEAVGVINSPDYQRVTVSSCGPGSITPYGIPAGLVSIETGGGETFSVTPDPGFFVIDVTTNGASMGRTNSVSLQNITSDIAIKARFGSMLTVSSEYGSPEPPTGVSYHWGNTQLQVPDSPVSVGGTQLVCLGWVGSGSVPTNGVGPDTGSVNISNDSTIAWQWKTNYWLKLDAGYGGQVITADGWHASGSNVTVQAQADPFFTFAGWSGASVVDSNAVVTTVSMGKAVCLQANFQAELSPMGVPEGWFASQGLTNGPPSEVETNDVDGDGLEAWEEFFAGTVEGDAGSVFEVIDLGQRDGSNFVKWLAGTNGSALPFCLQGSTNLAVGWYVLGEVPRSVEGTNCWWVPVDGGVTSEFYRVLIKTGL